MTKHNKPIVEKTPPLPADKPKTYESGKSKAGDTDNVGNRKSTSRTSSKSDSQNPQKTREKNEMDLTKRERNP